MRDMNMFNLLIMTPEKTLYQGNVVAAIIPGQEGIFEVLAHHASLVTLVKSGSIEIIKENHERESLTIPEGFFEFHHNQATLLF